MDDSRYLRSARSTSLAKRAIDVTVSALGLLVGLPIVFVVGILIKLDSRGPVFFRQTRMGLHRRPFRMWKFRKMPCDLLTQGPSLTSRYDVRLTRVGRVLERTKLDELPQLINVLLGDMSIVGPRPELPRFVEHWPEQWDAVLSVKPGVFGPNQLRNRNESDLYPPGCKNVEEFYLNFILSDKLDVDADYARRLGFARDARLLVACVLSTIFGTITRQTIRDKRWQMVNLVLLSAAAGLSAVVALAVTDEPLSSRLAAATIITALVVKTACLIGYRVPQTIIASATAQDFLQIVRCSVTGSTLTFFGLLAMRQAYTRVLLCDLAVFTTVLFLSKLLLYKLYLTFRVNVSSREHSRRLIFASLLLTPLSVTLAAAIVEAAGATTSHKRMFNLEFIACATLMRALVALTQPVFYKPSTIEYLLTQGPKILLSAMCGSCLTQFACVLLVNPLPRWHGIFLELVIWTVAMTSVAVVLNRRGRPNGEAQKNAAKRPRPVFLLVGSGLELSAYISALSALQEHEFSIAGVVTPHSHHRHGMTGGHPIIGDLHDIPAILELVPVAKVIVVRSSTFPDLANQEPICSLPRDQVLIVDHLNPLAELAPSANGQTAD